MAKAKKGGRGARGLRGIPGPPGPAGARGFTGSGGARGLIGKTGAAGRRGAAGKKGAQATANTPKNRTRLIKAVDRHIENIYGELNSQLTRLIKLQSHIDPLDFFPRNNIVLTDLLEVERRLTPVDSIEVIVDFMS